LALALKVESLALALALRVKSLLTSLHLIRRASRSKLPPGEFHNKFFPLGVIRPL